MKRGNLLGMVGYCVGRIRSSSSSRPRLPGGGGGGVWALLHQPNNKSTTTLSRRPNHSAVQLFQRSLCSSNSNNNNNNICLVKSVADLDSALSTIKGGKLPGILYYTAAWCGPCRAIAPIIEELGNKYPHVTTYKLDIDQEGLSSSLAKQSVSAVPTFQFFKDGKEATSIVGADVAKLKQTFENLYGN